jgi:hypothetical protein
MDQCMSPGPDSSEVSTRVVVARGGLPWQLGFVVVSAVVVLAATGCRTNSVFPDADPSHVLAVVLCDVPEPDVIHWGKADDGLQVGLLIRRKAAQPFYDLICHFRNTGDHATWILNPLCYYGNDSKSSLEFTINGQLYLPPAGGFFTSFPAAPSAESFVRLKPGQEIEGPVSYGLDEWRDVADLPGPPAPLPPWQVEVVFVYRNPWPDLVVPVQRYGLWNRGDGLNMFARLAPLWTGEARSGVVRVGMNQTVNPR